MKNSKYIFITGGVVSSVGKGLTAASLGALLEARGLSINIIKCDPYLNVDPGTLSPFQHGEVYVTEDGAETDLDLGHYERFTSAPLRKSNSITTGQIYENVISKERRGDFLGHTVQVIPHITDEIKSHICNKGKDSQIVIVEIGGTIGDIESLPFIEAIRQMRAELGFDNTVFIHVTLVPFVKAVNEFKSKPTQHSVKSFREAGIQPDFLICRSHKKIDESLKSKISLFCSVPPSNVIFTPDVDIIYEVPLLLHKEKLDHKVVEQLKIPTQEPQIQKWNQIVQTYKSPKKSITIGMVGKYVDLKDSYQSLHEALSHAGVASESQVDIEYIDSECLNNENVSTVLKDLDGIIVPGGFGQRGVSGKISAIQYARENKIPFLGICFGMQMAALEFARNVCGLKEASSKEFSDKSSDMVIHTMESQLGVTNKGATMRLGSYPCTIQKNTKAFEIYKTQNISERHRHRFELNNEYRNILEKNGMYLSGINEEDNLVEILEIPNHPWFLGVQFHPEFKSKPFLPHPVFDHFICASSLCKQKKSHKTTAVKDENSSHIQPVN